MISGILKYLQVLYHVWFSHPMYQIRKGYIHRKKVAFFDDTNNTDEWQKEVYAEAAKYMIQNHFNTLLDIGCGSGYKLLKYFKEYDFTGVEIEPTLSNLKSTYPENKWTTLESANGKSYDLIICSDVIEHVSHPGIFLENIIKNIDFKTIIISTPDRHIVRGVNDYGPPKNISHYREWNQKEFHAFISDYLLVRKHYISNPDQGTQVIYARKK